MDTTPVRRWLALLATAALPVVLLGACSIGGTTRPSRFYLLEPLATAHAAAPSELAVSIGPVQVPDYLDRPQLVARGPGREVLVDEYHRWAEPLQVTLPRLLARNLSTLLGTEHVALGARSGTVVAELEIERFEPTGRGAVALEARWSVRRGERSLVRSAAIAVALSPGAEPGDVVQAMNEAFDELSRAVADGVRELGAAR